MKCFRAVAVAGLVGVAMPVAQAAQETYVYTPTHGVSCSDRSRESFSQWRCPGPGGYVAEYVDEGNVAGIRRQRKQSNNHRTGLSKLVR